MRKLHQHKRSREQERLRKAAEPPSSENCSSAARRLLHTSPPLFFVCFLVFGHRLVGEQDLRVWWAGVAKLVLHGRILQVTHQSPQLAVGEVKVAILSTHHLREQQVQSSVGSTLVDPGGAGRIDQRLLVENLSYLHHVQLGKEVAVRQGQRVSVQEPARRLGRVWVLVLLVGQRCPQVAVQLLQGGYEAFPQP